MPDILGRYYTEQNISNLLVSSFRTDAPKTVLELGVGNGSLIKAARARWNHVRLITADIDSKNFRRLRKNIPNISVSKVNGLDREINEKLNITVGGVDVAVCNPPYKFIPKKNKRHIEILERAHFVNSLHLGRLTTDVVFLAQNLNLLSDDGELGIILPDTLLSGDSFRLFRLDLLKNASIMSIIQLPPGVFRKTEAQAHILLLKKRMQAQKHISLNMANHAGEIISEVTVSEESLVDRMDFSFHEKVISISTHNKGPSLKEIGAHLFRGSFSRKTLIEQLGEGNFFHLNNFNNTKSHAVTMNGKVLSKAARTGDILIARVGKRSVGKIALVKSGEFEVSDCVIVVRVPIHWREKVFKSLLSGKGKTWISAYSHGVCSKFISQKDLYNFPITL